MSGGGCCHPYGYEPADLIVHQLCSDAGGRRLEVDTARAADEVIVGIAVGTRDACRIYGKVMRYGTGVSAEPISRCYTLTMQLESWSLADEVSDGLGKAVRMRMYNLPNL